MTPLPADVLKKALDQVDRERKVTKLLLFALLAMTAAFWIGMILAKDEAKGLPLGLAAVMGSVYVAGMMASKASHDNTRMILKAIESLSMEKRND